MGKLRALTQINTIVVHCSATPNGKIFTANDIDNWHRERGFKRDIDIPYDADNTFGCLIDSGFTSIGYHFVIRCDGEIEIGRPLAESGAHVKSHNAYSVGICMIGTDKFTSEQWISLSGLVSNLQKLLPQIDEQNIVGHRDLFIGKLCPCFDVQTWLHKFSTPEYENILEAIE